jgi:hypothetical protein
MPEAAKAYSYIRFSTPQQAKGDSRTRQAEKAAKYAAEHGLALDTELKLDDFGVPAFRGQNARTGALAEFLDAVKKGYVQPGSYLLIENIDRLTRADIPEATSLFLQLITAEIVVVTLTNGETYSRERLVNEPWAMHVIVSELIRANQESFRKSGMVAEAMERRRRRLWSGQPLEKPHTRITPAWITWDDQSKTYRLIEERAALVRTIFERANEGWGLDSIARWLNEQGVETWGEGKRKAAYWRGSYMRKIATNEAAIGIFTPRRSTIDKATGRRRDTPLQPIRDFWPAAVDEELFGRVSRRIGSTAPRGRHVRGEVKSLVAGILKCAKCGGSVIRVSKGQYVYLVCARAHAKAAGCAYQAVHYADVEDVFRKYAEGIIESAPRGLNTEALEQQIKGYRAHIDNLEDEARDIADELIMNKSEALRKRLREKEKEIEQRQDELRALSTRRETLTSRSVQRRLQALQDALTREPFDVMQANAAMKQVVRKITMNAEQAMLEIEWHHVEADAPTQDLSFYSRHMRWGEN